MRLFLLSMGVSLLVGTILGVRFNKWVLPQPESSSSSLIIQPDKEEFAGFYFIPNKVECASADLAKCNYSPNCINLPGRYSRLYSLKRTGSGTAKPGRQMVCSPVNEKKIRFISLQREHYRIIRSNAYPNMATSIEM